MIKAKRRGHNSHKTSDYIGPVVCVGHCAS